MRVKRSPDSPACDELRVWAWDDQGAIWTAVRVPGSGPLPEPKGDDLGTILIQPGSVQGALRVHVRGIASGVRVLDGFIAITSLSGGSRTFDVVLQTTAIDDCPLVPNPELGACPTTNPADAGGAPNDGPPTPDSGASDGPPPRQTDAGGGGTTGGGGSGGVGSHAGDTGVAGNRSSAGMGGIETGSPPPVVLPGGACTTEEADARCDSPSSVCFNYCGPEHQGYKSLSCSHNKYVEGDCTFSPEKTYACYALGSVAACPGGPPTSATPCSLDGCMPCGSNVATGYYDGSKTPKVGYCVCSGGRWSCGSTKAWPCPGRSGC